MQIFSRRWRMAWVLKSRILEGRAWKECSKGKEWEQKVHRMRRESSVDLGSRSLFSLEREVWLRQQQDRQLRRWVGTWSLKTLNASVSSTDFILWKLISLKVCAEEHVGNQITVWQEWAAAIMYKENCGGAGGRETKDEASCYLSGIETLEPGPGNSMENGAEERGWRVLRGNVRVP